MRWIVYETRCLVSGKIYVGVHRQDEGGFDGYLGSGKALKRAIKKHGVENFVRRTLEEFSVEAEAYAREAEIVTEEFCKRRDTYNAKPGGVGAPCGNQYALGHKHTPEARQKIAEAKRGRTHSPETRQKVAEALRGKSLSPETRQKIAEALRGNKNFLGRKHSPESRQKIAEGNRGKAHSPESREKIREAALRWWANHRNNAL